MLEQTVTAILTAIGVYLALGAAGAVFLHLRALAIIDPATRASGLLFRVLITPGLVVFWPVMLLKWRRSSRGLETAGAVDLPISPNALRRWHAAATSGLLVLCPCILAAAMFARASVHAAQGAPSEVVFSRQVYTVEANMGNHFKSIPARALLARSTAREYGLVFRFPPDASVPPVALYWSETKAAPDVLVAPGATFLGMVWAGEELWIDLPQPEMRYRGYWLAYSFLNHTAEYVPSLGTKMKEAR